VLGPQRNSGDPGVGKVMNSADPPRHTALRRMVSRSLTARAVADLEPYVRAVTREVLAEALDQSSCNFAAVVATLPVASISALLGVPLSDWDLMLEMTSAACGTGGRQAPEASRAAMAQAHSRLLVYCRDLMRERRNDPRDDIVGQLTAAEAAGELTEEEVMLFFDLLILGGNETTRHAATGALLALHRYPEQWERLRADPGLLDPAVEEVLRWTTPSKHVIRRAREDVEMHGHKIRAGEDVVIWYVAANGDERVFADPDRFDAGRSPNPHLTLGSGIHFCLGSSLARLELRVFLQELTAQVSAAHLLTPVRRIPSTTINGVADLHVRLDPR